MRCAGRVAGASVIENGFAFSRRIVAEKMELFVYFAINFGGHVNVQK